MEDSAQMTIHDIQSWVVMSEDGEPAVTERAIRGWVRGAFMSSVPAKRVTMLESIEVLFFRILKFKAD